MTTIASVIPAALAQELAAMYNSLDTAGKKAAFTRKLKENGINLSLVTRETDQTIAELVGITDPAKQQARIDELYHGYTKAADKASFVKRLKAAELPLPTTPKKAATAQDELIQRLKAMMAADAPVAPGGKSAKAAKSA
jgi:hypothetical protein